MVAFQKALEIVLDAAHVLGAEKTGITDSVGRILAEDAKSDVDVPSCDRAVMDGYACRRQDLANDLTIVEKIPAGADPQKTIGPNQCAKIMTGAVMPAGADCVIMVECTVNPAPGMVRCSGQSSSDYIRRQGEDSKVGQVVLNKGTLIKSQHIAVLSATGHAVVCVAKKPMVGVIATGDELVEPPIRPRTSQTRNSNSLQIKAQIEGIGASVNYYGIAKDAVDEIDRLFKKAAAENDVVMVLGGVSMGEFDFVPMIMKRNNIEILFDRVAIKPGKPTTFGIGEGLRCFGIPGNPVSAFTVFEVLIKPFLYKMMGHDFAPPGIMLPLAGTVTRKDTERMSWIPVKIAHDGKLHAVDYHGSAHIDALCHADGLIGMDIGVAEIQKDTVVYTRLI